MNEATWTARFKQTFSEPRSAVAARVWQQVYGPEYPWWADPFSYVSVSELRQFAHGLQGLDGQRLVDVGCGRGGPGLWLAAVTGARLTGIDANDTALAAARRRAEEIGTAHLAEFRSGTFNETGLSAGSAQAVISIDALLFAPDKHAAAAELARILAPGGRLMLTSWDYHSQPEGRPAQVSDHRPLLEEAGFGVTGYEETEAWRDRQERIGQGLLAAVAELAAESGEDPAEYAARITEMNATTACMIRRVLITARRRPIAQSMPP